MQLESRRVYTGRVVRLDVDSVRFPDGSTGQLEIIRHPGAAAIVPCASDPGEKDPTILMIRQYRYAAGGFLWEIPAGTLDAGEDPETCARRELLEEDRKSTRLNSSHPSISYAVFCLKKKKKTRKRQNHKDTT